MTDRAQTLIEALPYIQRYQGRIVVVKYGGNAMVSDELRDGVIKDIILLSLAGVKVVLVHGGGPEINAALKSLSIESKFAGGLRVTDDATMKVVQMVLAGQTNKDLVALCVKHGGRALGLTGIDGGMLTAAKVRDIDGVNMGHVGDITKVDTRPITDALAAGYIPIIATIATDESGEAYNVNADTAAAAIAGALNAENIIVMSDVPGLMRDPSDPATLISDINVSEVPRLTKQGIITGGMIPKAACCVEAVRRGVVKAVMIDGRTPHAILIEMFTDEGVGTLFRGA